MVTSSISLLDFCLAVPIVVIKYCAVNSIGGTRKTIVRELSVQNFRTNNDEYCERSTSHCALPRRITDRHASQSRSGTTAPSTSTTGTAGRICVSSAAVHHERTSNYHRHHLQVRIDESQSQKFRTIFSLRALLPNTAKFTVCWLFELFVLRLCML